MSKKPLEQVTLFIDRSLGGKLVAQALRDAGAKAEVHDDHFPSDTPDVDWLAEVGRRGWVVLSKDERIRSVDFDPKRCHGFDLKRGHPFAA